MTILINKILEKPQFTWKAKSKILKTLKTVLGKTQFLFS